MLPAEGWQLGSISWVAVRELSNDDKKLIADHVQKAAAREVFTFAVCIVLRHRKPFPINGSGTCVSMGSRLFVATAAHVVAGYAPEDVTIIFDERFSTRAFTALRTNHTGGDDGDQVDAGYVEVDRSGDKIDTKSFLRADRLEERVVRVPKDFICAVGFCNERIPRKLWRRGIGILRATGFWIDTVDPASWDPDLNLLSSRDIVLDYPRELQVLETGAMVNAPDPSGASGAGIWRVNPNKADPPWAPSSTKLIGIQRSWRPKVRQVYGTQIQHWIRLIRADYPDLRSII